MKSPIINKIVIFGIISGFISLMLACFGFGVVEYFKVKHETLSRVHSQMDILAYNLEPTLVFDDKEAANKILQSLRDDPSINRVRIDRADGSLFAIYVRQNQPSNLTSEKHIIYNGNIIGRIQIESAYIGIQDKVSAYLLISLLIVILSIPASFLISEPIRRQVSDGVVQLEEQSNRLRLLADQVAATEQRERKRIAALIHDHLQQMLVAAKLHLDLAIRNSKKENFSAANVSLERCEEFLNETIQAAKSLTVELRPPVLYEAGVEAAFQWLAVKFKKDHDLEVNLHLTEVPLRIADNLKILIFESVKEILFNIVKHANVRSADLYLNCKDNLLFVCVKDQGKGFDIDQAQTASSNKGFGLFSIRERLKLLNGDLQITSDPKKGTEVKLVIPLELFSPAAPQKTMVKGQEPKVAEERNKKLVKILLVDDHKIVREGIANLLRENKMFDIVAQAENGLDAVEKTEIYLPDVIIMDINMPRLNGIEATRAIKKRFPNIDIIGLSVQDERNVAESMKQAGAYTLLNKAGDPQELVQTIFHCANKNGA